MNCYFVGNKLVPKALLKSRGVIYILFVISYLCKTKLNLVLEMSVSMQKGFFFFFLVNDAMSKEYTDWK